jgi:hypothetical protein
MPWVATVLAIALALPGSGFVRQASAHPRRDLGRDEQKGGHTLSQHVGRTDDQLRERLRREPRIAAASTYTDRSTAEEVIAVALAAGSARLRKWSRRSGRRPNLVLDYHGDIEHPIGRSLKRGDRHSVPCTDAVVVLKWDPTAGQFYVLTSYPEARP